MSWLEKCVSWSAHPDWYDYIHKINVQRSEMADGGGQHISLLCAFDWEIRIELQTERYEWGVVRLSYRDQPGESKYWPKLDLWQCMSGWIPYKISRGHYVIDGALNSFHYSTLKLEFQADPFPTGRSSLGLFNLIDPRARQPALVFYAQCIGDEATAKRLWEARKQLRTRRSRRVAWDPKRAVRESHCLTVWRQSLVEAFRDV